MKIPKEEKCEEEIFHFFYAADNLDAEQWNQRSPDNDKNLSEKDKMKLRIQSVITELMKTKIEPGQYPAKEVEKVSFFI